jgi:PhnB protein
MDFYPYLAFAGSCREAFTRYQEVFGGELVLIPASQAPAGEDVGSNPDLIIHAAVMVGSGLLMGSDDPSGQFDGRNHGMCAHAAVDGPDEARRVFDALADGGEVQLDLAPTFFSNAFGMCTDRFGTPWMVNRGDPVE